MVRSLTAVTVRYLSKEAGRADDGVVASAEVWALQKRIRELERGLGKRTLENEIFPIKPCS